MRYDKKRFGLVVFAVFVLSLLVIVPVLAAIYTSTITVTNSSGTSYSNYPFIASMNNTYLAANGYTSSSMLDVQVKDGSTVLPFMPADDKSLVVVPSLAANSSNALTWTSGNTPATSHQIITGNGGYVTIPYNAGLELGSAWKIKWAGLPTASSIFAYKVDCYKIYMNSGSIYAQVGSDSSPDAEVDTTLSLAYHALEVGMDGTNLYIIVDSNAPVTTAYTGSVSPASEDTATLQDVTYSDYLKISIGTLISGVYSLNLIGTWTADSTNNNVCAELSDSVYLYAIVETPSNHIRVLKIDPSTMLTISSWDDTTQEITAGRALVLDNSGYLYVGGYGLTTAHIVKIDTSNMSKVGSWDGTGATNCVNSFAFDGTYIYAGVYASDNNTSPLFQIDPSNMTTIGSWDYDNGSRGLGEEVSSLAFNGYLYAGWDYPSITTTAKIAKIDVSDMSTIATWTGYSAANQKVNVLLDDYAGNLYAGLNAGTDTLIKINESYFTTTSYWAGLPVHGLFLNTYIYALTWYSLNAIDTSTMATICSYAFSGDANCLASDYSYYYVGKTTSPGQIDKIELSSNPYYSYTETLKYQPNTIISGTILPDPDSTYDGTITWGSNPAGIAVTVGPIVVPTTTTTTTTTTSTTPIAVLPNQSAPNIVNNVTGGSGPSQQTVNQGIPLVGLAVFIGSFLNVPTMTIVNIGAMFLMFALGFGCIWFKLGPIITGMIMIALAVMFNVIHVFDYWMIFMMIVLIILSWLLPRQTQVIS